jgi:hypothetical protein
MPMVAALSALTCNASLEENPDDENLEISESSFQRKRNVLEQNHRQIIYSAKHFRRLMARLRTPAWLSLSGSAWEVCCYKAKSGWMFTAQTYRVVPRNSPIMEFAQCGDVKGIQELFEKKMASPYDRRSDGFTVLDVSAFNTGISPQADLCSK